MKQKRKWIFQQVIQFTVRKTSKQAQELKEAVFFSKKSCTKGISPMPDSSQSTLLRAEYLYVPRNSTPLSFFSFYILLFSTRTHILPTNRRIVSWSSDPLIGSRHVQIYRLIICFRVYFFRTHGMSKLVSSFSNADQ